MAESSTYRKYYKHIFFYFNFAAITSISLSDSKNSKTIQSIMVIYQIINLILTNYIDFKCVYFVFLQPGLAVIEFNVVSVIYFMGLALLFTNFLLSKLLVCFAGKRHKDFFNGLFDVDRKICEAFNVEVDFEKIQRDFWRVAVLGLIYYLTTCFPTYFLILRQSFATRIWVIVILKEMHTVAMVIFMIFFTRNLKERFRLTNQLLRQIEPVNENFTKLFEIHQDLCGLLNKINKQFGLLIFISISMDFATISIRSYVPLFHITINDYSNLLVETLTSTVLTLPMLIKVIWLIEAMDVLTRDAKQFANIFVENHQNLALVDLVGSEYYQLYFKHQNYNVYGTGSFKVNHQLIFTVI